MGLASIPLGGWGGRAVVTKEASRNLAWCFRDWQPQAEAGRAAQVGKSYLPAGPIGLFGGSWSGGPFPGLGM